MKKQLEKQKRYYDNNINIKSKIVIGEKENITNNVEIQNLWEVNQMFNKADCGLPMDEVSLISLVMNEMAQLNKFKSIRYNLTILRNKKIYKLLTI